MKAVINIKNKDEKCFLWSVITGLYEDFHAKNHERVSHYLEYEKEFNLQGIQFPMTLKDIPKFERLNNVSISVYAYQAAGGQEGFIYPKVSKEVNERHVNLLLIADDDTNHYCFIKDFGTLLGSQYSSAINKTYFCRFCLHGFSSHSAFKRLRKHEERCFTFAAQRIEYPDDPILKFENIRKQGEAPFTVYADFESILKQFSGDGNKCQEHVASSC